MTERRFNELRGEEVVYAEHRQERTLLTDADVCPLCPTRPGGPFRVDALPERMAEELRAAIERAG